MGESKRTSARRKEALALHAVVRRVSGFSELVPMLAWVEGLGTELNRERRKSRRFQAELLLAVGESGETV